MKGNILVALFFLTSSASLCQEIDSIVFDSTKFEILSPMTRDTLNSAFLTAKFDSVDKGIVFFYPNNKLRDQHDLAIKQISANKRFKDSKIIAIPCEKTTDDKDNVHFEEYNISNIQCFLFGIPSKDLPRALEVNSSFKMIDSIGPAHYYLLEIDKNIVCVNEDRISFHEDIILDFVDPILTEKQEIEDLKEEIQRLEIIISDFRVSLRNEINSLEKELRLELDKKTEKREKPKKLEKSKKRKK